MALQKVSSGNDSRVGNTPTATIVWDAACGVDVTDYDKALNVVLSAYAESTASHGNESFAQTALWYRLDGGSWVQVTGATAVAMASNGALTDNDPVGDSAGCQTTGNDEEWTTATGGAFNFNFAAIAEAQFGLDISGVGDEVLIEFSLDNGNVVLDVSITTAAAGATEQTINLNSDARVKVLDQTINLDSDSRVKVLDQTINLDSDSRVKVLDIFDLNLLSDSRVKKLDQGISLLSDADVKVYDQEISLLSDATVILLGAIELDSDARVKTLENPLSLLSDSRVKVLDQGISLLSDAKVVNIGTISLDSDARVKVLDTPLSLLSDAAVQVYDLEISLLSDARVKTLDIGISLLSDARVKIYDQGISLLSDARVRVTQTINLDSDARVKVLDTSLSLISDSRVKVYDQGISLLSDAKVTGVTALSLLSDARVKVRDQTLSLTSDAKVQLADQSLSLDSDARVKSLDQTINLLSDARVKTLDIGLSLLSDAKVIYLDQTINLPSDATVIYRDQTISLLSDGRVKVLDQSLSLLSDAKVTAGSVEISLTSDARVRVVDNGFNLLSDARVKAEQTLNLLSDAKVSPLRHIFLLSDARVSGQATFEISLTSDASVKVYDQSLSLTSDAKVIIPPKFTIVVDDSKVGQVRNLLVQAGRTATLVRDNDLVPIFYSGSIATIYTDFQDIIDVAGFWTPDDIFNSGTNFLSGAKIYPEEGRITFPTNLVGWDTSLAEGLITYAYIQGLTDEQIQLNIDIAESFVMMELWEDNIDFLGTATYEIFANHTMCTIAAYYSLMAINSSNAIQSGYNYRLGDFEIQTKLWGEGMIAETLLNKYWERCQKMLDALKYYQAKPDVPVYVIDRTKSRTPYNRDPAIFNTRMSGYFSKVQLYDSTHRYGIIIQRWG